MKKVFVVLLLLALVAFVSFFIGSRTNKQFTILECNESGNRFINTLTSNQKDVRLRGVPKFAVAKKENACLVLYTLLYSDGSVIDFINDSNSGLQWGSWIDLSVINNPMANDHFVRIRSEHFGF